MLNVLLIEDDFDFAETVGDYLELESIVCDYASNGVAGLQLVGENAYDVILLDLNLPRLDGLSLCERLRAAGNDTPILMLTARDRLDDKLAGFEAGTDDYLVKPFELKELVVRIHALAKRRSGQIRVLRCGDLEMNLKEGSVVRAGRGIRLSPTGWKILETLLRASPAVVSRQKLMDAVWGETPPDSNSLKVHLFNLRKAVDGPFAMPLLHTVPGKGFAVKAEDGS
ncbi:DNA-binding response OmpR family regulator [Desulfosalsimonas propionicica]|uniref:DNA-binding response OmpR family regulator n=1 Tax=Desulfosalsimonas propionicica TaxID=332175 RepID=A0A7W0C748_9BACT|nr:response regulator transcription factor [Desulfosalsimonas propionicica]MBA2880358.1 DNA-binding response OmpR family regulator [Desulfosalsimonas propionicica]